MSAKPLSVEKLENFKTILEKEKTETIEIIKSIQESLSDLARDGEYSHSTDPEDQGDCGSCNDYVERQVYLLEKENEKLRFLNESLKRIYNKTYGICKICGEHIPDARLKIVPYAKLCIKCKSEEEKRHH